jgi:hypothetical protein
MNMNRLQIPKKINFFILLFLCILIFNPFFASAEGGTPTSTMSPVEVTSTPITATQVIEGGIVSPSPTSSDVTSIDKVEYSGEVTKIDGRTLTIDTSAGTKQVTVPDNLQVKKNGYDSKLEEIKVNDKVAFAQSSGGELLSLSATSAEVTDFSKRAIPFVIGGLVLLGLIFYLLAQRNKGHIKTTTEKVN